MGDHLNHTGLVDTQKWHTRQVDFMTSYPHPPIYNDMYMELPHGIGSRWGKEFFLQLLNNLYGNKQSGLVRNEYLVSGLKQIGFKQSAVD